MANKRELKPFDLRQYPIVPLVGVGVMLTRDNSLLLVKRKYDPDAGYWAIPGGHLDLGERVENAVRLVRGSDTLMKAEIPVRSPAPGNRRCNGVAECGQPEEGRRENAVDISRSRHACRTVHPAGKAFPVTVPVVNGSRDLQPGG